MKRTQYSENIRMALETLRSHKFRSFLTVLGVIIGVLTVVMISSILTGVRKNLISLVQEYGTDNIYAFHLKSGFQGMPSRQEMARKPLTIEDARALKMGSMSIEDVAYQGISLVHWQGRTVRYRAESFSRAKISGVSPNFGDIINSGLEEGRFLSASDNHRAADVGIIGSNVVEALFPHTRRVLGRSIKLDGHPITIVGVLGKRKNSLFGESDDDNAVYIPHQTMRKLSPEDRFLMIIVRAREDQLAQAMDETESILRRQRGLRFDQSNNFDLNTADKMIEQFDALTATMGLVAIAISAVGLMVGGIGVMNIMLVSVTERTREIGLRKAVGAKRQDIIFQFLFEAMTLTTVGGLIGMLLSILGSYVLAYFMPSLPATIPLWALTAGFVVSVSVGLIFGVFPAFKAASLDPIESLRWE